MSSFAEFYFLSPKPLRGMKVWTRFWKKTWFLKKFFSSWSQFNISANKTHTNVRFDGTDYAAWKKVAFAHPAAGWLAWVFLLLSFDVHISKMDVQTWWELGWPWRVIDNFQALLLWKVIFEAEQIWGPAVWPRPPRSGGGVSTVLSSAVGPLSHSLKCNPVREEKYKNTKKKGGAVGPLSLSLKCNLIREKKYKYRKTKVGLAWAVCSAQHPPLGPLSLSLKCNPVGKRIQKKYKKIQTSWGRLSSAVGPLSLSLLQPCWKNAKIIWHKIKQVLIVLIVKAATTGTSIFLLLQKTDPAGF